MTDAAETITTNDLAESLKISRDADGAPIAAPNLESLWAIEPQRFQQMLAAVRANGRGIEAINQRREPPSYEISGGVAIIDINGPSTKYADWFTYLFGGSVHTEIEELVKAAAADSEVGAILLRIDSPGGTVAGVSDVADAVWAARQMMPTVAYISDLGASAAYYVASQAEYVYADEDALVGSIGTLAVVDDWSRMFENAGIQTHVLSTGSQKGAFVMGARVKDEHLEAYQRIVDELGAIFVDTVARGRGWDRGKVEALADGRLYVARSEAFSSNLIDGIHNFDAVLAELIAEIGGEDDGKTIRRVVERPGEEQPMFGKTKKAGETTGEQIDQKAVDEAVAKAKAEAQETERGRVAEINQALTADIFAEARQQAIEDGLSLEAAKAKALDAACEQIGRLDGQIEEMQARLEAVATGGGQAVEQAAGDDQAKAEAEAKAAAEQADPAGRYQKRLDALVEGGKTAREAHGFASKEDPEGHEAWVKAQQPGAKK